MLWGCSVLVLALTFVGYKGAFIDAYLYDFKRRIWKRD